MFIIMLILILSLDRYAANERGQLCAYYNGQFYYPRVYMGPAVCIHSGLAGKPLYTPRLVNTTFSQRWYTDILYRSYRQDFGSHYYGNYEEIHSFEQTLADRPRSF